MHAARPVARATNCTRTVKANAGRHKAMNYGYMVKAEGELKAQIAAVFVRAKSTDEAERNEPGEF